MSRDPYLTLRAELVQAAHRTAAPAPTARSAWSRRWRHSRTTLSLAAAVGLAAAAVAAAAVTGMSLPLVGTVSGDSQPGVTAAGSYDGTRYRISVSPSLIPGSDAAGWLAAISYRDPKTGQPVGGVVGGGGYPTAGKELFQGTEVDGLGGSAIGDEHGQKVAFVITGPDVAAVQVAGRTVPTFTSAQLPDGDRAAVFMVPVRSQLPVVPLDAAGHALPNPLPATVSYPGSAWRAPQSPAPGACELSTSRSDLVAQGGRTVSSIQPVSGAQGQLFTSCVNTQYAFGGDSLDVAVLVDARRPGQSLASIPGTQAVDADGTIVDDEATGLTARRVGNAWLVVQDPVASSGAKADRAARLAALGALSISRFVMPGRG